MDDLPKVKKVMLIEDDAAILDVYKTILEKEGFEVQTFSLGMEAMKAIKETRLSPFDRPDVVLLDLILPDMSGIEVLREVKGNDETRGIKVFIFTNEEGVESTIPAEIKPDKYVIKANITPTDLAELLKKELI